MSARSVEVNVFVTEPISKMVAGPSGRRPRYQ